MLTGDMLLLSFVEGGGFRELMGFVEPDYKPPTATRVEKMHEESAAELRGGLQRVDLVTITTV